MAFEQSKFGDGSASGAGNVTTTVSNHYGPRFVGKGTGDSASDQSVKELSMDIDGTMVSNEAFVLLAPSIRAASIIEDVYLEVQEVFVLGGTTPGLEVGTDGTEATNGVSITEAQLEAVGVYDLTSALSGTWAAGLTAATTVGMALSGTSPTSTSAGKARLVVRYVHV